jgi:hypothetical protein
MASELLGRSLAPRRPVPFPLPHPCDTASDPFAASISSPTVGDHFGLRSGSNDREVAMGFVQVIEFRTSKFGEMQKVADEWEKATEGKRLARRRVLCQDRESTSRYFNIVFFDSYEDAMKNSALPETDTLSKKMMGFAEGPPTFYNLDVVDEGA